MTIITLLLNHPFVRWARTRSTCFLEPFLGKAHEDSMIMLPGGHWSLTDAFRGGEKSCDQ